MDRIFGCIGNRNNVILNLKLLGLLHLLTFISVFRMNLKILYPCL